MQYLSQIYFKPYISDSFDGDSPSAIIPTMYDRRKACNTANTKCWYWHEEIPAWVPNDARLNVPVLDYPSEDWEEYSVDITITNYSDYPNGTEFDITLSGGSYTRTDNVITWTLPAVTTDEFHSLSILAYNDAISGIQPSNKTKIYINVKDLSSEDDQTYVVNDTNFATIIDTYYNTETVETTEEVQGGLDSNYSLGNIINETVTQYADKIYVDTSKYPAVIGDSFKTDFGEEFEAIDVQTDANGTYLTPNPTLENIPSELYLLNHKAISTTIYQDSGEENWVGCVNTVSTQVKSSTAKNVEQFKDVLIVDPNKNANPVPGDKFVTDMNEVFTVINVDKDRKLANIPMPQVQFINQDDTYKYYFTEGVNFCRAFIGIDKKLYFDRTNPSAAPVCTLVPDIPECDFVNEEILGLFSYTGDRILYIVSTRGLYGMPLGINDGENNGQDWYKYDLTKSTNEIKMYKVTNINPLEISHMVTDLTHFWFIIMKDGSVNYLWDQTNDQSHSKLHGVTKTCDWNTTTDLRYGECNSFAIESLKNVHDIKIYAYATDRAYGSDYECMGMLVHYKDCSVRYFPQPEDSLDNVKLPFYAERISVSYPFRAVYVSPDVFFRFDLETLKPTAGVMTYVDAVSGKQYFYAPESSHDFHFWSNSIPSGMNDWVQSDIFPKIRNLTLVPYSWAINDNSGAFITFTADDGTVYAKNNTSANYGEDPSTTEVYGPDYDYNNHGDELYKIIPNIKTTEPYYGTLNPWSENSLGVSIYLEYTTKTLRVTGGTYRYTHSDDVNYFTTQFEEYPQATDINLVEVEETTKQETGDIFVYPAQELVTVPNDFYPLTEFEFNNEEQFIRLVDINADTVVQHFYNYNLPETNEFTVKFKQPENACLIELTTELKKLVP